MNKDFVYKRRLLKLADFLENLPPERFNYQSWVGDDWEGKANLSCNTTACALGWATTIPSFRKLGLRMIKNDLLSDMAFVGMVDHIDANASYAPREAAKEIFDLNRSEFEWLFLPGSSSKYIKCDIDIDEEYGPGDDASAKEVAAHIRIFVAAKYKI